MVWGCALLTDKYVRAVMSRPGQQKSPVPSVGKTFITGKKSLACLQPYNTDILN